MQKETDRNPKDLKQKGTLSKDPKDGKGVTSDVPKDKAVKRALVASEPELTSNQVFLNKQFLKAYLKYDLE